MSAVSSRKLLLRSLGMDSESNESPRDFGSSTPRAVEGLTPVLICSLAASGELQALKDILAEDPSVDLSTPDYDRRTPLHLSAEEGHLEVVEFLVSKGARLNCIDKFGATPLRCAIAHNHTEVADFLRSKGATVYLAAFAEDRSGASETNILSENELEHIRVIFNSIDPKKPENSNEVSAESVKQWLKKNAGFQFKIHKVAQRELERMAARGEAVPWRRFVSTMKKKSLLERAFKDQLSIHRWSTFCVTVTEIFNKIKATVPAGSGKQACYIPELGNVDPNLFSMSICTVDGQMFSIGDNEDYPLEAAANPLLYSLLVERLGYEKVHEYIGKEPSGSFFNAFTLNADDKPHNACVNTGAIVMCNLFEPNKQSSERFRALLNGVSDLAGAKCGFSQAVYLSEKATAMRNFALAHFMASNGALTKNSKAINDSLDFYFQLCSIEANCQRLATIAATYANNGVNPITGERVLHASTVKQTVAMLYSCGIYIQSGEWACNVGLPAKTGISGCIWLVIPGVAGLAIYAPPCDENGTSVRAAALAKALADRFSWHLFDVLYSNFT